MDDLNCFVVTLLALINPVICGVIRLSVRPSAPSCCSGWDLSGCVPDRPWRGDHHDRLRHVRARECFAATAEQEGSSWEPSSLDPSVLFAASPGTISTVLVMVLRPASSADRNSSLISRFLGLILIAMGLQFVLTNLRAFFQAAG